MTTLYLARHGETEENVAQILQGQTPGHLTENGRAQAAALADKLARSGTHFDALVASDLTRAVDTAHILNGRLHLPFTLCPLLRERDFGSFTGVKITYAQTHPVPSDAESVEQMFGRARRFLIYILESFPGQTVIAVGHGLFDRCIQAVIRATSISEIPRMGNAEVRRFELDGQNFGAAHESADAVSAD